MIQAFTAALITVTVLVLCALWPMPVIAFGLWTLIGVIYNKAPVTIVQVVPGKDTKDE